MSFQDRESGRGNGLRRGYVNGKQDPTQAVASGIFQINTAVSTFHCVVNTLGTPKDTPELREKLHKTRLHIGQLVKDTLAKLKQASETDHHVEVSASKKIADAKLAKDFQAVLKEFQKAQRLVAERETAYTPFVPQAVLPCSYSDGYIDGSTDTNTEQRALLVESRRQDVLLLDNEIAFNEAIIEEREQGIQEIQQQIGEVNEIFKDLAVLVHEQGTMIDDIGSHIEGAHAATAQGKSQLAKAAKTQRSNSSLAASTMITMRSTIPNITSSKHVCKAERSDMEMKVQLFQQLLHSSLRIAVIFLISIGYSVYASSDRQIAYVDKYIAKSYFDKYDILIEQEFENFMANEISLGLCKVLKDKCHVVPTQSGLLRSVTGEGSHRHLSSSIRFKLQHELKPELNARSCEFIIIERLPSGVFADPFELQHLVHRGVFTGAAVFGDTNLELPSFRSNRSVVEIHMSIASKMLSWYEDDLEVNLEVPLHARYPPLGLEFSRVEFRQPDLLMCCSLKGNGPNRSCLSMPIDHISDEKAGSIIWEIPCGIKEHVGIVSYVTFGSAVVTALVIVLTSISYSNSEVSNRLKHS